MKYIRQILKVWIGFDSDIALPLLEDGVSPQGVTRAVFRFGNYCLDSAKDLTISVIENETEVYVYMVLGHIPELVKGDYVGYLTIYDAEAPNGLPWGDPVLVKVDEWFACITTTTI